MPGEAEKYRFAAKAARNMANKAADPQLRAKWLEHAAKWERMAEEAERSSNDDEKD